MVKFTIFIFLVFANIALAEESPNPVPSPREHIQAVQNSRSDENQKTNTQYDPTEKSPPPLNLSETPETPQIKPNPSNQPSQPSPDERIVWFTGVLAAVGIIQVIVYAIQAYYMRRGLVITQQAANAATKSADTSETSLRKVGRAYLSVTHWQLINFTPGKDAEALCFFVNAGQRPAKLKKNFCGYCFSEKLPPIPDYKQIAPTYEGEPITIHPREERMLPLAIYNVGTTDYEAAQRKETRLYFYGCFIYDDVLDGEHKTTFFAWYDVDNRRFSQVYDLGYNISD